MSDGADGSSSRKRPRQAPDLDRAPVALWLTAIVALAAAAGVGYWVFGRDEPTPPSQGAALTIGDAAAVLVSAEEAGGGLAEQPEDAEVTVLSLSDVDDGSDCGARLVDAGLLAWDPAAGGTEDALARRVLVTAAGAALSHEVAPWSADDLAEVRDAVAECPEVPLAGDAGAGTAQLSVRAPAAEAGDDALLVEVAIVPEGSPTIRTTTAEVWVRDGITSTIARSGPAGGAGAPPVDDARLGALVAASDARLETALDHVS